MNFFILYYRLVEANQQICSSPGRKLLEKHYEKVKLLHQNGSNLSTPLPGGATTGGVTSSPSLFYSAYVTPTKSRTSNTDNNNNDPKYELLVTIPKAAIEFPLNPSLSEDNNSNQSNQEVISSPISMENILDELIHSKLLLASIAAELQEEKHVVHILSKANQKYAEKVFFFVLTSLFFIFICFYLFFTQ